MHDCKNCSKKHTCDSKLDTEQTMKAIFKIFMVPFALFLLGIAIGIISYPNSEFKYLMGFGIGFVLIMTTFFIIKKGSNKKEDRNT